MKKQGNISKKRQTPLGWIYSYSKKYLWMVALISILSALIAGGFVALAVASKAILDIATGGGEGSIVKSCLLLGGIIAGQAVGNILHSNLRVRALSKIEMAMKQGLLTKLMDKRYQELTGIHTGELMNRLTSDVEIVAGGVVGFVPQVVSIFTKILAGLGVMITLDWKFTLLILVGGSLLGGLSRLYSRKFRFLHKEVQRTNGRVRSFMQECLENIVVIKSFVEEQTVEEELDQRQRENYKIRVRQNAVSNIARTGLYVMTVAGYYTALAWGALQIAKGALTFGTLTAFLQILDQIKAPFQNASGLMPWYDRMIASAERLMELEQLQDEDKRQAVEDVREFYREMESIRMEHGCFAYDEKAVLRDVSLTLRKGRITAIVGESGNGKSTLFHLLLGLLELQEGTLFFETGKGPRKVDAGTRNLFSYVPQGNMILSGSIRENILFGNRKAKEADIQKALETACLTEVIAELPMGLDTELGERGIGLSEGQRQRIAIARALVNDAPILLLDECTSALDLETEKRLLSNLRRVEDKTVICISHRSAAMECCDEVIVIEEGEARQGEESS